MVLALARLPTGKGSQRARSLARELAESVCSSCFMPAAVHLLYVLYNIYT